MKTIRKRIVAIAAICALIMGLSLGGLSYYYSGHMATEDSETLMLAKSEETKAKLDSILSGIQQSVETLTEIAVSELDDFDSFKKNEVYISDSFSQKYGLNEGDEVKLDAQYEKKTYTFKVKGIYDKSQSIAVFMPIDKFADIFDLKDDQRYILQQKDGLIVQYLSGKTI